MSLPRPWACPWADSRDSGTGQEDPWASPWGAHTSESLLSLKDTCCSSFGGQIMPSATSSCPIPNYAFSPLSSPPPKSKALGEWWGKYIRFLKRLLAWETSRKPSVDTNTLTCNMLCLLLPPSLPSALFSLSSFYFIQFNSSANTSLVPFTGP